MPKHPVRRRRRVRPARLLISFIALWALASWIFGHRAPGVSARARIAQGTLARAVAAAAGPHLRTLDTAAGGPDVLALGSGPHPTEVLVDGRLGHGPAQIYPAYPVWSQGRIVSLRLGAPWSGTAMAGDYGLGSVDGYTYYATAVARQFQTVTVLRAQTGQRWLFAFSAPAAAVRFAAASNGRGLVVRYEAQSGWRTGAIALQATGPRVLSPALLAMAQSHNHNSLFIRIVESARRYFGSGVVATIENGFYSLTDAVQRAYYHLTGHVASTPSLAKSVATRLAATWHPAAPVPVLGQLPHDIAVPASWPGAAGEGVWRPVGPDIGGAPAMEETFLHPDAARSWATTYLVWINPAALRLHYVPGTEEPVSLSGIHGTGVFPNDPSVERRIVAAFNAGFKSESTAFGAMSDGELYAPAVPGIATLAIYQDGRVALGAWGTDAVLQAGIASFRQNLPLIVDRGAVSPRLDQPKAWGIVVGNSTYVWRSGIGITARGDLVYAAGDPLSAFTLARSLQAAGAIRAMQLDINSYWVTFNFYNWVQAGSGQGNLVGTKLSADMVRPPSRFLTPDTRDFFYLTQH